MIKRLFRLIWLIAIVVTSTATLWAQSKIRVQGIVVSIDEETQGINRASITVDDIFVGYSDEGGKFSISVERDAVLEFNKSEYETLEYELNGEQEITVKLKPLYIEIGEVVVLGKDLSNKVSAEPTDIEVKGNYFHMKTKFSIPYKLMRTDYRFVVQPTVMDLTTKMSYNMRPVVIDGDHYDIIEHRSMHFGQTEDELEEYIVENTITKQDHIYPYKDSIYIENQFLENSFQADCVLAIASYHEPAKFLDTVTIANGTVNPLRFFDTAGAGGLEIDESKYAPAPELELHNTKGVADIEFEIGKSIINFDNPKNERNVNQIKEIIDAVQGDEYATLRSVAMRGYASPDGTFHINQALADERTRTLLNIVTNEVDGEQLRFIELTSKGVVERWSRVWQLVEEDSLTTLSNKLRDIIQKTGDNFTTTQQQIRALPEYRSTLSQSYLPRLRRVEYEVDYSIFRPLTLEEIRNIYRAGTEKLSRYEYFKLIEGEGRQSARIEYEQAAIKEYPNFTIMVNREALRLIKSDSVNLELLQPLLSDSDVPYEIRYNQAIMALAEKNVDMADSLLAKIELTERTMFLKRAVRTIKGDFEENYEYFARRGGLNEVLILLCLKRDQEAFEKMKILMQDRELAEIADYNYVLAICANRNMDLNTAMIYLQVALNKKPELIEVAKIDSDVLDIYELIKVEDEIKVEEKTKVEEEVESEEEEAESGE